MSAFKVGEVVVVCNVTGEYAHLNGAEVTILSKLKEHITVTGRLLGYVIDHPGKYGTGMVVEPHNLRRKRPPTTGEESIMALFRQDVRAREGVAG